MSVTPVNVLSKNLLETVKQFDNNDLEDFLYQVLNIRAKRIAPSLSKEETELFQKINRGLTQTQYKRLEYLSDKLFDETISSKEHQEYMELSSEMETLNVERLQAVSKLAIIRNKGLKEMMIVLGLNN